MSSIRSVPCKYTDAADSMRMRLCALFFVTILSYGAVLEAAPMQGKPAPDFALRTFDKTNVRLSELRGEVVIVNFWAAWCGPCQQELPRLNDLYQRYQRAGLVLLGINLDDDMGRAHDMAQRLALSFPMLFDPSKEIGRLYALETMPMTVFIDRDGNVRHVHETFRNDDDALYLRQIRELLDE